MTWHDSVLRRLYYRASWGLWLLSEGGVHESDVWMGRAYAKEPSRGNVDENSPFHEEL